MKLVSNRLSSVRFKVYDTIAFDEQNMWFLAEWHSWACMIDLNPDFFQSNEKEVFKDTSLVDLWKTTKDNLTLLCKLNSDMYLALVTDLKEIDRHTTLREIEEMRSDDPDFELERIIRGYKRVLVDLIKWFEQNDLPLPKASTKSSVTKTDGPKKSGPSKAKLKEIYDSGADIYDGFRKQFGDKQGTPYGANSNALKNTQKELKKRYGVVLSLRNLQEAIRRRKRPPMKVGKE